MINTKAYFGHYNNYIHFYNPGKDKLEFNLLDNALISIEINTLLRSYGDKGTKDVY